MILQNVLRKYVMLYCMMVLVHNYATLHESVDVVEYIGLTNISELLVQNDQCKIVTIGYTI